MISRSAYACMLVLSTLKWWSIRYRRFPHLLTTSTPYLHAGVGDEIKGHIGSKGLTLTDCRLCAYFPYHSTPEGGGLLYICMAFGTM